MNFSKVQETIYLGKGCRQCTSSISKLETNWLNSLNISEKYRNKSIKINNRIFYPDAIDAQNKIIYEFYGDFWHGNPKIFNANDVNKYNKKNIW